MSNKGQWIEVQIRSERMNDVAEQGFAAHWKYKEGGGSEDEGELEKWLRTIKEILDDPQPDAMDFLDTIKLNLFASEIFVFTPKGEIKRCRKTVRHWILHSPSIHSWAAIASELKSTTSWCP